MRPPSDPAKMNEWLEAQKPYMEAVNKRSEELMASGVPFAVALVMASDEVQAAQWEAEVEAGEMPAERGVNLIGSYARFEYAIRWVERGWLTHDWLRENLPELWRGADPDDTDPRYLRIWRQAWIANGMRAVRDGKPLPAGRTLTVYRGQQPHEEVGFAWSLDPKTAAKFARGIRVGTLRGDVLRASVARHDVLGFLTGRGESEVVADPRDVVILGRKRVAP